MLDAWARDPRDRGGFNDLGQDRSVSLEALRRGPLRGADRGTLIVERVADGLPIGSVSWHRVSYGPGGRSDAWNMGIDLRPEFRGQGYGTEAQRLLAGWLFANTDLNRVEASTDVENLAEQRSLEKAGFLCEGIQRGAQLRAGAFHDLVTYARLRTDEPA
jgi:RimJ/RimL family protein N-acetyltransferase